MPRMEEGPVGAVKRKRAASKDVPIKRARSESSDEDTQSRIVLLENQIIESKKNYNNISTLLDILRDENDDGENIMLAAVSLCRVFARLLATGELKKKQGVAEKDSIVVQWLKERFLEYKSALLELLTVDGAGSTVLTLAMRTLKCEGTHLRNGDEYSFPLTFLMEIVDALLDDEVDEDLRQEYSEKYMEEYDDIRYYTFEAIEKLLRSSDQGEQMSFENTLQILTSIESVPESKEELEDFYTPAPKRTTNSLYSLNAHKKRAQAAWIALLQLKMSKEQRKAVLGLMADTIAPWFMKPELLMDFLTDSYGAGGSTSLQALSGVFYLIQEKNLDYPLFYKKLYSLLDAGLLHSKHRSRFFRLLETFLGSTHLPAVLVASFIKRLSRLSLNAPPAGIVAVVPWIYNLLKKHPTCTFMIHREIRGDTAKAELERLGMEDPFNAEEEDPMETDAIESSLWEIATLQSHYHPNVATLAKIISEQFTKQAYNLEDFLDHSYGSMLDAELSKEVKKVPVIEFEIPKKIITRHEEGSGLVDNLVASLWNFS